MAKEKKVGWYISWETRCPAVRRKILPGSVAHVFLSQNCISFMALCLSCHLSFYLHLDLKPAWLGCLASCLLSNSRTELVFPFLPPTCLCQASLTCHFHVCFCFTASFRLQGVNSHLAFYWGKQGQQGMRGIHEKPSYFPAIVTPGLPLHQEYTSSYL